MRLALVSRRFWPLIGGAERVMSQLATEFRARGHEVTVVTARWEPHWPVELRHRDVPVVRLPQPRTRAWGTWRYMRALSRWLIEHRQEYDVVLVSMLKHDAYAAVAARHRHGLAVVVRAEGGGVSGDVHWQSAGRFGGRIRRVTGRADGFIAPSPAIAEEMRAVGYPAERIAVVPNGVAMSPQVTPSLRQAARQTLGEFHPGLAISRDAPLAVYTGRLHEGKGLLDLIEAWVEVLAVDRSARLWLVGEGEFEGALRRRIHDLGLEGAVVLAGAFDEMQDVLMAANVFVLPSYEEGLSLSLLEAMSVGLPVVVSDLPGNRRAVRDGREGRCVPVRQPQALAKAMLETFHGESIEQRGAAGRLRVETEFSLETMVDAHLDCFRRVLDQRRHEEV